MIMVDQIKLFYDVVCCCVSSQRTKFFCTITQNKEVEGFSHTSIP